LETAGCFQKRIRVVALACGHRALRIGRGLSIDIPPFTITPGLRVANGRKAPFRVANMKRVSS